MSAFPVLTPQGIKEGINYLLSGPSGSGQNFDGYSAGNIAFLTGNPQTPYTTLSISLYSTSNANSNVITVSNSSSLTTGMTVYGAGIPSNTTISNITSNTLTITNNSYGNITSNLSYTNTAYINVNNISLSNATMTDGYTSIFTFSSTQTIPPFQLGNPVTVAGVTGVGVYGYNQTYSPIGVVACTINNVTVRTSNIGSILSNGTGGNVSLTTYNTVTTNSKFLSTDCIANATVTDNTNRVFLAGELNYILSTTGSGTLNVTVAINRYKLIIAPNNNSANNLQQIYTYVYDATVIQDIQNATSTIVTEVFPSIIDTPTIGTYQYRIDMAFNNYSGTIVPTTCELLNRSLTSQVVKQ
jgi:hypothetical protein